jgi:hypothetical protein
MKGGQLTRNDRVERAEDIELATVVGGGVTEDGDLNVHRKTALYIGA